jgi:hypothetical protein
MLRNTNAFDPLIRCARRRRRSTVTMTIEYRICWLLLLLRCGSGLREQRQTWNLVAPWVCDRFALSWITLG